MMPPTIPAAPRKTLLEWIEDDGDTPAFTAPACNAKAQALHARIYLASSDGTFEPLPPPAGLRIAPLG